VEPGEAEAYRAVFGAERVLVLPFSNQGLHVTRNWIKARSIDEGHVRHWQLDDNLQRAQRVYRGRRTTCRMGLALAVCEDFTDRYENIAISGLNYEMFVIPTECPPPYFLNAHVYSCTLVLNAAPFSWRHRYNDDTDLCLQALAAGWCTVLLNAFCVKKLQTMKLKGGNTPIYQRDGRLEMARSLERRWPGVVSVSRRFERPQHVVRDSWRKFDTPLKRRADIDWNNLQPNEYGMVLRSAPRKETLT